jgi:hypothetical protein
MGGPLAHRKDIVFVKQVRGRDGQFEQVAPGAENTSDQPETKEAWARSFVLICEIHRDSPTFCFIGLRV